MTKKIAMALAASITSLSILGAMTSDQVTLEDAQHRANEQAWELPTHQTFIAELARSLIARCYSMPATATANENQAHLQFIDDCITLLGSWAQRMREFNTNIAHNLAILNLHLTSAHTSLRNRIDQQQHNTPSKRVSAVEYFLTHQRTR